MRAEGWEHRGHSRAMVPGLPPRPAGSFGHAPLYQTSSAGSHVSWTWRLQTTTFYCFSWFWCRHQGLLILALTCGCARTVD